MSSSWVSSHPIIGLTPKLTIWIYWLQYIHIYIYIYIFTNVISTSIHGTRKKEKKNRQEQEIRISRITAWGKEKILLIKKKEKTNLVRPLEKNQGICSQLVKRKLKPSTNTAMLQLQKCSTRVEPIIKLT